MNLLTNVCNCAILGFTYFWACLKKKKEERKLSEELDVQDWEDDSPEVLTYRLCALGKSLCVSAEFTRGSGVTASIPCLIFGHGLHKTKQDLPPPGRQDDWIKCGWRQEWCPPKRCVFFKKMTTNFYNFVVPRLE
ncbi:hypothetical protein CRE_01273 [Caenorhabditis remanei]|uniref:Uncharacterized protein n=1 Tax=Caenorhabditis remanei TaxID=31234 RepID=E3N9P9_CAERE|nr:hypothetical protein CRE_01273 [Caenorhabditis remanei]